MTVTKFINICVFRICELTVHVPFVELAGSPVRLERLRPQVIALCRLRMLELVKSGHANLYRSVRAIGSLGPKLHHRGLVSILVAEI